MILSRDRRTPLTIILLASIAMAPVDQAKAFDNGEPILTAQRRGSATPTKVGRGKSSPASAVTDGSELPEYLTPDEIGTYDRREKAAADDSRPAEVRGVRSSGAVVGLLSDDVALTIDGEARLGFHFGENFDLDRNAGFQTLNYMSSRAALQPTLYLRELAQVVRLIDLLPDVLWGGQAAWNPSFVEGYLQFITMAGTFRVGRQKRHFGLGLAFSRQDEGEVPFGFLVHGPTEDRIDWSLQTRLSGLRLRVNTTFSWLEEPLAEGILSRSDRLRAGLTAGLSTSERFDLDVQALYDWQKSDRLQSLDLALYTRLSLSSWMDWQTELGHQRGKTGEYLVYDALGRSITNPDLTLEGYRGVSRLVLTDLRTRKGLYFDGTEIRGALATGQRAANPFGAGAIQQSGTSDVACGCLMATRFIVPQLRTAWRTRATADLNGVRQEEELRESVDQAQASQGSLDGFWTAAFVGKLGFKGFETAVGYFFLRSVQPVETRVLLSDGGTTGAAFDDTYRRGSTLGHEVDVTFRYTFHDHIQVGLDAGMFISGSVLDVVPESKGPAYMILPRLTVFF